MTFLKNLRAKAVSLLLAALVCSDPARAASNKTFLATRPLNRWGTPFQHGEPIVEDNFYDTHGGKDIFHDARGGPMETDCAQQPAYGETECAQNGMRATAEFLSSCAMGAAGLLRGLCCPPRRTQTEYVSDRDDGNVRPNGNGIDLTEVQARCLREQQLEQLFRRCCWEQGCHGT